MKELTKLQKEIELIRIELDRELLRTDTFDHCYQKSTELDKLLEEYIETAIKRLEK